MNKDQLAELEQRTYRVAIDDGLSDIVLGAFLCSIAAAIWTGLAVLPALVPLLAVPLWKNFRHSVTEPRAGYVRLQTARVRRLRQARRGLKLLAVVVLLVVLAIIAFDPPWRAELRATGAAGIGVLVALFVAIGGYLLEARRLYVYALLIVAGFGLAKLTGQPAYVGPAATGITVSAVGLYLLARFMRKYPLQPSGAHHDG